MRSLVVEKDQSLAFREVNIPRYNEYQALVKTIACGMCGTDVKLIHQAFKGIPKSEYPILLGHEGVGEVVEVGAKVKSLKPGDRVMLPFVDPDPENLPGYGSGWGAMSEYAVVSDPLAPWPEGVPDCAYAQRVLADDIDPVDAVMIVTFREVLSNIRYFGIKKGDPVVIVGCGAVGRAFIKMCKLEGAGPVTAVVRNEEKAGSAKDAGADVVLNSSRSDVTGRIRAMFPEGVPFVIDAVGSEAVINEAMGYICDRGNICGYGVPASEQLHIDFSRADYNWILNFQQMPRKKEEGQMHDQIVEWIRAGKLDLKDFISDYFTFDQAIEAYGKLLDHKILKKGVITF